MITLCRCVALLILALCACSGCATQGGIDPYEKMNRAMYEFDDNLDKYALKPMADAYVFAVPKPIRTGLGNGFDNMAYFNVIFNDFLQGKVEQGFSDSGRMLINSTFGLAGFFDVASSMGLPSHENDFGITLGKWGVPAGPYLVLPLLGPATVRDVPGIGVTIATNPLTYVETPVGVSLALTISQIADARARAQVGVRFRDQAAIDPYVFTRDAYLQWRESRIHEGKPTVDPSMYDEDLGADEPAATAPAK